jgi:indolepyruvate ferredoxin oxidoreductase beta subunit
MADIYLVGVGGQGIITASRIIGDAAILARKNVLLSETHGMAQRGGSVVCTARIGEVYSPLIPDGQADVVLSFELLEALRAVCKASKNTVIVSSNERMIPLSVSSQKLKYPTLDEVRIEVAKIAREFVLIEASKLAGEAGVPMSSNIVMVGALAGTGLTNLDKNHFEKAIEMNIARDVRENLAAFSKGFDAVSRRKSA